MNAIQKIKQGLWAISAVLLLILFVQPAHGASPVLASSQRSSLANALQDGHHVLMIRHADAPGFSDPTGFSVSDCSSQRNLGERGREQARALGVWLTTQGVDSARMFSSPWCRCLDTARLMDKGPVTAQPSLGSFFQDMGDATQQTLALSQWLAQQMTLSPWQALILVTHQVNISAFTGQSVGQGEVMLVKVSPQGAYLSHRLIPTPN